VTHLEKFIELYTEFGIECKVNKHDDRQVILLALASNAKYNDKLVTYSNKFGGYSRFFSLVVFDLEGNFMKQEFWE
jgi:hypothetical protein